MDWDAADLEKIEKLARYVSEYDLSKIEISEGNSRIVIKRQKPTVDGDMANQDTNTSLGREKKSYNHKQTDYDSQSGDRVLRKKNLVAGTVDLNVIAEMKEIQDELARMKEDIVFHEEISDNDIANKIIKDSELSVNGVYVKSPMAGIFYKQPKPDAEPYVESGQHVKKGDTLCLIEAMKMITEVNAPCDGIVKEFLLKNGQFVEFESPLVLIEEEP